MSRRGHKTGIISSYHYTWLLKTDGEGCVWISDPVRYDSEGTDTRASVTEVRHRRVPHPSWHILRCGAVHGRLTGGSLWTIPWRVSGPVCRAERACQCLTPWRPASRHSPRLQVFLYSALVNIHDIPRAPYPTARSPGREPYSLQDFNSGRRRAQAAIIPQHEKLACSTECRVLRSGRRLLRRKPAMLPVGMLHLTTRLAPDVYLGRCVALSDLLPQSPITCSL